MTSRSYITTSPRPASTVVDRNSTQSPRLSVLQRAQEAKREDDALLIRAARRESLAHRLASGRTTADGALTLTAESPKRITAAPRRLGGQDIPSRNILPQETGHQPFSVDVLAAILQENHNMDPERATRVMRIWEAVIKCLDEISISMDVTPRNLTCPSRNVLNDDTPSGTQPPPKPAAQELSSEHQGQSEVPDDTAGPKYPCPFRKRNPVRFNIREHEACAQTSFAFIELRKHITSYHKKQPHPRQCRRCRAQFSNDMALLEHLMLPKDQICDVKSSPGDYDQEDGICPDIERALNDPERPDSSWTWETIWRLLFPCDTEIPDSDFHPMVELFEVDHAFDTDEQSLKTNLRDTLRLLLPTEGIDDEYCGFLAGQLDLVFQAHRASVMRQCLEQCGSASTPSAPLSSSSSDCTATSTETDRQSYSSARRGSKRRSAGLSILSPTSPSRSGAVKTLKAFACADQKSRVADGSVSPLERQDTTTAMTTPTLVNGTPTIEAFKSTARDSTSRDSLDSAIGMSATCCDLCSQDPCCCREVILSCIDASTSMPSTSAFEEDRHGYWKNRELLEQQQLQLQQQLIPKQQPTRTLRRTGQMISQEKVLHPDKEFGDNYCALGISAPGKDKSSDIREEANLNDNGGRLTPSNRIVGENGEDDTGHSPQSFKERVMRERHFSYVRGS
ncbi:hypothetical protein QBC40DRAFT_255744 [Triangularia verruculosa]|uniref:C2H2-type domain-containing protein n=1 Tax=Triangularia verruculosa TaxID=2587418 RepID=A0AAN6XEF8_9PEZI|nr:hypothetical protein QBC40DRAFT_255744 [Triangularia verruculosa]